MLLRRWFVSRKKLLGENIRRARRFNDMTLAEVGEAIGVGYGSVAKWERDENTPTLDHIIKLADLFGLPLTILVEEKLTGIVAMIPEIEALPEVKKQELAGLVRDFIDRAKRP